MYLRVPWWVMYLSSCLFFLKKTTSWLRLADASGLDFQCCFHHDLGPHQHCGSFNDPIHEETTLSAGIHHHVTWRCVLDQGHHDLFITRHVSKHRCFKLPGLAPESLNSTPWVFSSRSLVPFGIAMRMRWWRRMAIQPREACCTPGHWEIWLLYRGSRNLFAVLVNFCWFCVPFSWEDAYDCHVFRKNTCNHLLTTTILYASDVPFGPWHSHGSYFPGSC